MTSAESPPNDVSRDGALLAAAAPVRALPDLIELVIDLTRMERQPTYWSGGRSGWQELDGDIAAVLGCPAIRLKGLGIAPHDGRAGMAPSAQVYDRWPGQAPDPHLGIGEDLEFCLRNSTPTPEGGLRSSAALIEFEASTSLSRSGVAAPVPVMVIAHASGANFAGERLAVSVTGLPLNRDARADILLRDPDPGLLSAEMVRLTDALEVPGLTGNLSPHDRLTLLRACYQSFGQSLAAFSRAGWFRYSGHAGNILIDPGGRAVMVDLDSCRTADSSLTGSVFAMETIRDGMSGLYNLACSFFPATAMSIFPDDDLLANEPFSGFIAGWLQTGNGDQSLLPQDVLERTGLTIAAYVIESRTKLRFFSDFLNSPTPAGDHLYRYVRHDRDLTFIWLYRLAYQLAQIRDGAAALPLSLDELDARLLRFAGRERLERALQLCSRCGLEGA